MNFEIIHKGFPDKKNYSYFGKGTLDQTTDDIFFDKMHLLTHYLYPLIKDNVELFFIRHGNSLHSGPIFSQGKNLLSKGTKSVFGTKLIDTSLTPLGIIEALKLKETMRDELNDDSEKIFITSYLNRAQHTTALLKYDSKELKNQKKLM